MRIVRQSLRLRAVLALAALSGVAALRLPGLYALLAAVAVLNLLFEPASVRLFAQPRFWIFALAPPAIAGVFLGPRDLTLVCLRLSSQGLADGLAMSARAVCLLLIFQLALGALSVSRLIRMLHFRGFRGLGFALGVAHNMLATLSETSSTVLHTLRLRGALRRHPVKSLRLFIVAVVSAALRHGEDIVHAASARGFDAR